MLRAVGKDEQRTRWLDVARALSDESFWERARAEKIPLVELRTLIKLLAAAETNGRAMRMLREPARATARSGLARYEWHRACRDALEAARKPAASLDELARELHHSLSDFPNGRKLTVEQVQKELSDYARPSHARWKPSGLAATLACACREFFCGFEPTSEDEEKLRTLRGAQLKELKERLRKKRARAQSDAQRAFGKWER